VYQVEFTDGEEGEYAANIIAQNMYAQCDSEGNQFLLLDAFINHHSDGHAVDKSNMWIRVGNNRHMRKTTKGWHLCVQWKDGTTSWERLADLKESNPVEVAEYASATGIVDQPAFAWWCPHVMKKRDRIIAAVKAHVLKKDHKFGIKIPRN
jgi:hypothetical protein